MDISTYLREFVELGVDLRVSVVFIHATHAPIPPLPTVYTIPASDNGTVFQHFVMPISRRCNASMIR